MSETISFSTQQLASGLRSGTLAEPITTSQVGGPNTVTQRVVAAIVGDGDSLLESGETGFILANGSNLEGGITRTTLNGANDPVTVTAHGWARIRAVEPLYLNDYLTFTTDEGFKVSGANARPGNSITWTLNDKDGAAQKLDAAQFVVNTGGVTGPVSVAMDFDGDIIASGIYSETNAPAEAALTLQAQDGDVIAIDFLTNSLTLNGVVVTGTEIDQFFAAYTASAGNTLTIGSADTATFAVKDLTLERSDKTAAPNTAPFIAVSQVVSDILDGSDLADRVKVADIQILDDGIGTNILSLSGEDASLFEIIGTGLYLKAGTDIDLATNPTLRVFVTVEDQSLPDAPVSAEVVVQVRDAVTVESIISFGSVQLTAQPGNVVDPISTDNLGTGTDYRKQALIAIEGDGDRAFEAGETGYVLAALKDDLVHTRLTTLNTATDPVSITGHGWYRSSAVSQLNLNAAMVYDPVTGFRIESSSSRPGDSLTWHLNEKDGVAQKLALVSFVVHSAGTVSASFDVDGDVIQSGSYGNGRLATPDALLTINLNDGDIVRIDFATSSFTVNGQALPAGTASQFFSGFAASDQSTITIGGIGVGGFSVGDLTLHRGGGGTPPPTNLPPSVSLANIVASVAETRDMSVALKVADIVVTDDGMGTNVLGLTGANAALFEIVGTELFLKAGTVLDFETAQSLQVTVTVDDTTLGAAGSVEATVPFVLSVTDANEGPVVSLANVVASVSEAQDTSVPLKVADIVVTDDGIGSNILALSGTDAGLFEIVGTELFLKAGVALDFETLQSLSVSVDVDDTTIGTAGSVESSIVLTLPVGDANEAPVVTLANVVTGVAETQDLSVRLKVADIVVTDDALGTNALTLSGADAALFEIVGTELFLRAGTVLDFETVPSLSVSVDLDDTTLGLAGSVESTVGLTLAVTDANELPVVTLANVVASVSEGQDLAAPFKVADIVVTDDSIGTNTLVLSGADAALFEIVGTELFLKAGAVLDFETLPSLSISVDVDDTTIGASGSIEGSAPLTLPVTDANEAPVVTLTNVVASIPEDQNLTSALKVADIVVTDDALGTNALTLSGANAALFEIVGTELFLRAGTALDFETLASLSVSVDLDDTTIGAPGSIESSAGLSLSVADVKETWGIIELDGAVGEWPAFSLLASDPSGAEVRGTYQDGAFIVALSTNGVPIGPNTTFWFDTDLNSATGYQVFGNTVGAEFNVNIGADGRPVLYTGADGETEVTPLIHKFSADGTVLEFALPSSLVGGATSANLFVDLSNSLFIPGNYADGGLPIGDNLSATVTLANQITSIPEDQNLTAALKVADIVVSDDTIGTNTLTLSGANAALFEIVGTELFLRAGTALDFETLASLSVSVDLDDTTIGAPGSIESSAGLSVAVTDVKETWGIIELDGAVGEWPGYTLLASDNTYEVRGTYQDGAFVIALSTGGAAIGPNTTFWLNTDLDPTTGYQVFGSAVGAEYNINIGPDGRPALYSGTAGETLVSPLIFSFNADRSVLEFALPSDLVGGSAAAKLYLDVNDTVFIPADYFSSTGLAIGDNIAPSVTLTPVLTQIAENANVSARTKVADIVVTDDGIGTNELKLSGADAALFEIVGSELFLKAGAALDFETNATLDVSVDVDDTTIGTAGSVEVSAPLSVTVTDVEEQFGTITLDGSTAEWAANTQLYTRSTGGVDYTVHGTYGAGAFLIALEAETLEIGVDTTIWLNTDRNAATGFQVFGNGVGAEYNIEFEANGTLALYTGDAGQTFVSTLNYFFDADRGTVEIALPSTLVGGSTNLEMFIDVNNTTFLPEFYSSGGFVVRETTPVQPTDPAVRIAIVYSESSANAYFDKTAYGQLVMSAQNQAMQAGIPFDLISEADLTDIAKIKDYDAIVFPEFSHVEASLVQGIVDTLTEASQTYGIGFIASGNFMTNTDTGAVIGSDAYARMKSLLGVTLGASGSTTGLTMNAEDVTHPISDGYTSNELVGTYSNTGFQSFIDFNGTGQVLFTQTTTTQGEVAAVIATTTGGRNVHFASDAISGNNNVLQEAIQWSARGDLPEVSLEMTRGASLFFSRNDMDQSQETFDVVFQNPGIYDAMLPIVQNWYEDYNFVGSYYINVGANPPDQQTNWAVSSPYYQQLLAMENEIGTHSYTHPENTNFLLPDVMTQAELDAAKAGDSAFSAAIGGRTLAQVNAEMAAALSASDPDTVTSVNLSSFSAVQRALLQHSFTFQWEYSRQIIEQQLGLSNLGGAVPGAPEQLYSTFNILPFVSYLTGGYAGVGAGYPGAFGFLDPNHTEQVYFAPNVSFDFSLIGFRNLTPAQAEEVWAQEYANITSHGGAPIIHFPWHDYGPTNWDIDEGNGPTYTQQMFTNFIERAYLDGTEFVTGADLAERILAFSQAQLSIEQSGSNLVVTATGGDLGTFALEMEEGLTIANVGNWYAYDDGKVFLDRDGGVYTVAFGSQSDDVTHIVKLPMRADLISVFGDGSDLEFSFDGRGDVGVELKSLGGNSVVASGADSASLNGDTLTMSFGSVGIHNGDIDYQSGATVLGTAGDDFILLSDQGRTVNAGLGNDVMTAGLGADVFVFGPAVGSDRVLAFDLSVDHIDLVGTTFGSTAAVVSALTQTDDGLELSFSATDKILFADLIAGNLTEAHFSLENIA